MKNCGLPQLKDICRTISELESMSSGCSSSNPALLFSILYLISKDPKKGRTQISRSLATSEQIVRSAIKRLTEAGFLFKDGRIKRVKSSLAEAMDCLFIRRLFTNLENIGWENPLLVGVHFSNGKKISINEAISIRDEIITWGGSGAIVFQVSNKSIDVPGIETIKEIEDILRVEKIGKKDGILALVSTKYEYNDYLILYGFIKKICEIHAVE